MSAPPVPADLFRRVLAHLAGGVVVVTSRGPDGAPSGLTATAVCSVSLDPPLVLACLARKSRTSRAIRSSGAYALHFIGRGEERLARRFALGRSDKFDGLEVERGVTGAPILPTVIAWCDCAVERMVEAGDHLLFVGRVEAARVLRPGAAEPLVHYLGRYGTLAGSEDGGGTAGGSRVEDGGGADGAPAGSAGP